MSMNSKTQYSQDVSSQLDLYIQCNFNKNLSNYFFGYKQTGYKVYRKRKRLKIANTILTENNNVRGLMLSTFKI